MLPTSSVSSFNSVSSSSSNSYRARVRGVPNPSSINARSQYCLKSNVSNGEFKTGYVKWVVSNRVFDTGCFKLGGWTSVNLVLEAMHSRVPALV